MTKLVLACATALVLSGPTLLRYQYKPGQVYRYKVEDHGVTKLRSGGEERIASTQTTTMTVEKKVISFEAGKAVVESTPVDGTTEIKAGQGTITRVVKSLTHIYTMSPTGKALKVDRRPPAGEANLGPQPLEGLTFSVPDKAVSPGATWTETILVLGLDRKALQVTAASRYVRDVSHLGHPCAEIDVKFKTKPAEVSLSGTAHYYLAKDIGQEVEATGDVWYAATAGSVTGRDVPRGKQTLHLTTRQTLIR